MPPSCYRMMLLNVPKNNQSHSHRNTYTYTLHHHYSLCKFKFWQEQFIRNTLGYILSLVKLQYKENALAN